MKRIVCLLLLLSSCVQKAPKDCSDTIVSLQLVDRLGSAETISHKERLKPFQKMDFHQPQPYQKVLRVYGRNTTGQTGSRITSYHENGLLFQYLEVLNGRANGLYRQWHPNGALHIEAHLIEGTADLNELAQSSWIFDGMSRVFDEEGHCIAEIPYEKGLLHNVSRYYFPEGQLQKTIPYEKGLVHGLFQTFALDGSVLEEVPYVCDEKQGKATAYWEPGKLMYEEEYELGILLNASYYDLSSNSVSKVEEKTGKKAQFKEGYLYSLMQYHNGVPEGEMQIFHPNHVLYRSYFLHEGKKEGEEIEYYPAQLGETLRPKILLSWHEDKIQGQVKTWYQNGQIESQREITDNKKQGLCFAWYKNGDLMLVEEYEFDRLIKATYYKKGDKKAVSRIDAGKGAASLYSPEGLFLRKIPYDKGKPQLQENLF
jgi:antitoxin component YwqK of YwqJK toxin-antitoxin module